MKPHIICHMAITIDGKINGEALASVADLDDYETTADTLDSNAWIVGRTTMQEHFAAPEPFVSTTNQPAGPRPVHVAEQADSFAIAVDTTGKLRWAGSRLGDSHLICILSERAPEDYLAMLREQGISYIVAGAQATDLPRAMDLLGEHFGIRRLLLEGGGHINGGFADAGLIDEVSLLIAPGIDGRHDIPAVFDGMRSTNQAAIPLKLKSVEQRPGDVLWLRYDVVRR
jgi:riboflavin biosynthesis pyrimidine reductase